MVGVIGPDAGNFAGTDVAGDIVDVAVGLVGIDAVLDPDDLFQIQVFLQHHFDLFLVQIGNVTAGIGVQQAHLGGDQGAFAVDMDGAAFQDEVQACGAAVGIGTVGVNANQVTDLLCHCVIVGPGEVQAVNQAAPCVEDPVNTADLALVVDDEGRTGVADPSVVVAHFHNADVLGQTGAAVGILSIADQHGHGSVLGDSHSDLRVGALSGLGTLTPVVGTLGPDHENVLLGLKFTGHTEAVLLGSRAINTLCHDKFPPEK